MVFHYPLSPVVPADSFPGCPVPSSACTSSTLLPRAPRTVAAVPRRPPLVLSHTASTRSSPDRSRAARMLYGPIGTGKASEGGGRAVAEVAGERKPRWS